MRPSELRGEPGAKHKNQNQNVNIAVNSDGRIQLYDFLGSFWDATPSSVFDFGINLFHGGGHLSHFCKTVCKFTTDFRNPNHSGNLCISFALLENANGSANLCALWFLAAVLPGPGAAENLGWRRGRPMGMGNNLAYWRLCRSCHGVVEAILHPISPGPGLGDGAWGGCVWLDAFILLAWGLVLVACGWRLWLLVVGGLWLASGLGCLWCLGLCCLVSGAALLLRFWVRLWMLLLVLWVLGGPVCMCVKVVQHDTPFVIPGLARTFVSRTQH